MSVLFCKHLHNESLFLKKKFEAESHSAVKNHQKKFFKDPCTHKAHEAYLRTLLTKRMCACFLLMFGRVCTDVYETVFGGSLLPYELKF